jgi:hypothetical protein
LAESRFNEYATMEAPLRQDADLGSHIQERLRRCIRGNCQGGLMNFQIEPLVTLKA